MNINILYIFVAVLILWSIYGYFASKAEDTPYTVLQSKTNYEVRLYPSHIVAQTEVKGSYNESLNAGFRIIASYIFGGNTKKEKIAMTTPVIEKTSTSEKIAMTTPVTTTLEGETHTIAFGMPQSYTLETLPVPDDSRIQIVTIQLNLSTAIFFSGMITS
jgi:hypothetical protein